MREQIIKYEKQNREVKCRLKECYEVINELEEVAINSVNNSDEQAIQLQELEERNKVLEQQLQEMTDQMEELANKHKEALDTVIKLPYTRLVK